MYKCKKCGNVASFEEHNVYKTFVSQNHEGRITNTEDKFLEREDVMCLECRSTLSDGYIEETEHIFKERD